MDIVNRIAGAAGLDESTAQKAIGMMLAFLRREGPADAVGELLAKVPGSAALADAHAGGGGFSLPGIMGLGSQLMGAGLSMPQIQAVSKELFAAGREVAGEETMGRIVQAIPGLGQFV
jgi:hypothetical protein